MLHQAASVSFLRMKSHFSCSACQSVRGALGWRWASAFASACHVNSFWTKIKHPSETCHFCDYFSQNTELPDKKKCYSILLVFFPLHQATLCRHQTPSPLCPCGARAEACTSTSPQLPRWSLQILSEQVELGRQMYQQLEVDAEFFSRSGRSIRITVQLSHHRSLNFKKELRYPQVGDI